MHFCYFCQYNYQCFSPVKAVGRRAGGTENCLKRGQIEIERRGCKKEISKIKNISVVQNGAVIETYI